MVYEMYSIKDELVGFGSPFLSDNESVACRQFSALVNTEGNMPYFRPKEFTLYRIGSFDTTSGIITTLSSPAYVVDAESIKERD